jgi:hypothetical protein
MSTAVHWREFFHETWQGHLASEVRAPFATDVTVEDAAHI